VSDQELDYFAQDLVSYCDRAGREIEIVWINCDGKAPDRPENSIPSW
jgi:hypothetical protein